MPSPFPGMDPYLEAPQFFPDLHHELISGIREKLNGVLRPAYHSMVEERVYISDENDLGRRVIIPDVSVMRPGKLPNRQDGRGATASEPERVADLAVAEPVVATMLVDEEIREARLVIYDAIGRTVVTVIEIVSPTNKVLGARGRDSYESKRKEVLNSSAHLVEIDLLRDGAPLCHGESIPTHDYLVHVSRCGDRPRGTLWPILVTQRLPVINIPLLPKDPDCELDLADIFDTAYERAGYDMLIDYTAAPITPLAEPTATWAKNWLARR